MVTTSPKKMCPPDNAINALIVGDSMAPPELSEHVGDCTDCQNRMESIATSGAKHLSATIRGLDQIDPPSQSAFWPALNSAELAITREYSADTDPEHEDEDPVDLSFLRPSPIPGRLGRLGEFDIIRVIGKGGMGVVLHAFDPNLQRDVAIKILDPHLATNVTARQRFTREARSAAAVNHDNLVTIYQVDEDSRSGLPYLVMQLVIGESLEQRLRKVGKLSIADVTRLGVQLGAGLTAAHTGGLIHRDIKPGNILIETATDKAILTDFGLARAAEDLKLTKTGMVAGTPLYMAPEQANGLDPDQRADLFSLGSVLYESLAGKPAFDARTPLAVLRRIADENHVPLRTVNKEVPVWLDEVIEGLLKKDPNERIGSAREVVERLANHAECVIPPLIGISSDKCAIAKATKHAIKSNRSFRRLAATFLFGTFGIGALSGAVLALFLAPKLEHEKTVTQEKLVEIPVEKIVYSPNKFEAGPAPLLTFPSQNGAIWSISPDEQGTMLVTGYESGRVQMWDLRDTKGKATGFDAHKGPVWSASYSPNGKMLVTASDDNFVIVQNIAKKSEPINLIHPNAVRSAVMHWDEKIVVSGDRSGLVYIWDVDSQSAVPLNHGAAINSIALSPDRLGIASSGTDGRIVLWEIPPTKERQRNELKGGHRGPVYGLSYNFDGTLLASAGWDGQVIIWNPNNASQVKSFVAHEEGVWAVDFSPCCKFLATAGNDGLVKLWDVGGDDPKSAKLVATFSRHKGAVHSVKFFSDATRLASGGRDGTAMVWDISKLLNQH